MRDDLLSPLPVLDESTPGVTRVAAPWLGVLWLGTIPLHLAQAYFYRELFAIDGNPAEYADHIGRLILPWTAAFLPALYARAVFVRACGLGLRSGARVGAEALRVPPAQLLNLLYTVLLSEVLFGLLVWTWVGLPLAVSVAGLAFATAPLVEKPGLLRPLREIAAALAPRKAFIALLFTYGCALLVAYVNLYFLGRAAVWAAGALGGLDALRWEHLLRPVPLFPVMPAESLPRWICLAGAVALVEPFWLASLCVLVHRLGLRTSGEDLRIWFDRLREVR